jgi:tryptophan-rich sensory protein
MRQRAGQSCEIGWLLIFLASTFGVALFGGRVTVGAVAEWYPTLRKPSWTPPAWVFGPVWTVLYTLMAIAAWLVRRGASARPAQAKSALRLWWLQLALNLSWSLVFFGRRRPEWGLVVIGALELAIVGTALLAIRVSRAGAALLVPYGVWTAFALALNYRITQLNTGASPLR